MDGRRVAPSLPGVAARASLLGDGTVFRTRDGVYGRNWGGGVPREAGRILEAHIGYEPGVYPEVGAAAPWLPGPVYMITVANFNSFSELVTVRDSRGVEFVLPAAQFSELVAGDPGLAAAGPAARIVLAGPGLGGRYQGVPRSVASAARRVVWAYTSFMRVSDEGLLAPHDGDRSQVPAGRWARFDPGIPLDEGRRDLGYEMHPLVGAGGRVVGLTFQSPSELADSQYEHKALPLAKYSVRKGWDVVGSRDVPWPSTGVEYVLAHGEPGIASMYFADGTEEGIDGRRFAELLLGRLRPGVKCVVLLSCHGASGPDPVAQQIANINNVVVFANNGKPTFHVPLDEEKGYTAKGFYVSIQDTREWVEFRPEPTGGRLSELAQIAGWPENVTLELVRILRRLLPVTLEDDEISFVSTLCAAGEAERFRVASFRVASLSGGAIAPLTADTMAAFLNSFTGWRSEHATYGVENLRNGARAYDSGSRWAPYEDPDEPDESDGRDGDTSRRTLSASRPAGVRPAESAGEAAEGTAPMPAGGPVPGEWAQPAPPQETAPQPELTPSAWFNALLDPDPSGQDPEVWGGEGSGLGAVDWEAVLRLVGEIGGSAVPDGPAGADGELGGEAAGVEEGVLWGGSAGAWGEGSGFAGGQVGGVPAEWGMQWGGGLSEFGEFGLVHGMEGVEGGLLDPAAGEFPLGGGVEGSGLAGGQFGMLPEVSSRPRSRHRPTAGPWRY
ncbi:hypothetical protein ACWCQR_52790, partial [Streptomyces sp. NPDC002172]